ncbi:immediate early response gene 2 protein [Protopterus annectens]|uniref:immediate early response gene 2 protein n=1 Tax=Protopterus annectens TaxID=7888 RepID=UPI001CFBD29B|nr:immediate early response gene 2 protein [Protopterus annectens]
MELKQEAHRIMSLSVWKMYNCRLQRGGVRLHRSLQLSLVMRNARDMYLSAKVQLEQNGFYTEGDSMEVDARASPNPDVTSSVTEVAEMDCQSQPVEIQCEKPMAEVVISNSSPVARDTTEVSDKENVNPNAGRCPQADVAAAEDSQLRGCRKRTSSCFRQKAILEPDFLPSKKARLELEETPGEPEGVTPFQPVVGTFSSVHSSVRSEPTAPDQPLTCRQGGLVVAPVLRPVVAF